MGCVVNSDTGKPVCVDDCRLTRAEFDKAKIAESSRPGKGSPVGEFTVLCGVT
jgi:hypothetical protein